MKSGAVSIKIYVNVAVYAAVIYKEGFMGTLFKEHSYSMVRLFLNQIVMSVFGTVMCLSTQNNVTLLVASGILSICMLLFIDYTLMWEVGAKDKIRIDGGRLKSTPAKGLFIGLCGNIPNLVLTVFIGIGAIIDTAAGQSIATVCDPIMRLLNGMYLGIFVTVYDAVYPEGTLLINYWWWYFIIVLPAVLTCFAAYYFGSKGISISGLLGLKKTGADENN